MRNYIFVAFIGGLGILALVAGFVVVGSPQKSRDINLDRQRLQDISSLRYNIESYYRKQRSLPVSLDNVSNEEVKTDPETKKPYEYKITSDTTFEICATFLADLNEKTDSYYLPTGEERAYYKKGYNCLPYSIPEYLVPTAIPVPAIEIFPSTSSGDIIY
ncbi:hypothetical protein A3F34_02485 [Candidatus Roizmanbacteria bacterium RIFCSPHIGHO2_12_FULL_44_10]|uniref:Type II secretion system protein GspG C-terminal domain-containing protein n=1 Tax=Candidatus Roizmanbacteria bacterium RIFCSPHIGHO2_12_FULL_44_10 TaxID=1802054 RepID=A0A1F7I845_9BACT|nr:MAG: hypothetical protein A3F34_02485 [Candidatus Roizmanbacteria bacterium RIFCSPHIGHO2_12_FULL_44_10]